MEINTILEGAPSAPIIWCSCFWTPCIEPHLMLCMGGTRELPCATWQACPILLQCFLQSLWAAIRPPSPSLSGLSNYDQFLSPIIVQALRRDSTAPCRDATDRRGCLSRGRRSTQSLLEEAQYTTYQTSHSSLLTYHCHHSCQASLTAPLLTPHLSHLTHHFSLTNVMDHSLSCQASLTAPLLTTSRGRRSTQSLLEELRRAWSPLGPRLPFYGARGRRWGRGCLSRCRRSTQSLLEELRRAWSPLGPRLPLAWQAQYTEPPGAAARVVAAEAAAAFHVAGTQSLLEELRRAWSPLHGARLPFAVAFRVARAVHRASWRSCGARGRRWGRGCLSRGRRSTPLITCHSSLLTYHCHHSCQASLTAPLLTPHLSRLTHHFSLTIVTTHVKHHSPLHFSPSRVAGAVHRASWRSCGARGRRWGRGCLSRGRRSIHHLSHVTHHFSLAIVTTHVKHHSPLHFSPLTYHISLITSHLPLSPLMSSITHRSTSHHLAWQAQKQSLLEWSPLGPRLPFAWQAQYTEPPGGAAERVVAAGAAAAFLRRPWSPLGLPFAWQAQYTESPGGAAARVVAAGAAVAFRVAGAVHHLSHVTHHFSLTTVTTHVKHHSPLHFSPPTYHISPITSHLPLSPLMSSITHRSTSHHLAWQAQYTEPPGGAAARVVAAGAAAAFRVAGAV